MASVPIDLKRGRLLPAAKAVLAAAKALSRIPMIKHEQEEFYHMLGEACALLQACRQVREIFPLAITYAPKEEASLVSTLEELVAILEAETQNGARDILDSRQSVFNQGKSELAEGNSTAARATFSALVREFPEDAPLMTQVGEAFMDGGLYEDASHYLGLAAALSPQSTHVLNRLGIALRKMGRFDLAEEKFRSALSLDPKDPNLYFNLGRLYLDVRQWQSCLECAEAALALDSSFTQAAQMVAYCSRMLKS
jgi:Flp pilus assembly protein TadD